jgi:sugar phosphate isomerase/epimerase
MIKVSFSTLACPSWTLSQVLAIAQREAYDGVELRFLRGEDSLWKLSEFQKSQIADTRRTIADSGLRISCLDTSCRFDSPRLADRQAWVSEGVRMAELAQEIGAPGIRVFGDRVPPESDREMTRAWIVDSLHCLARQTDKSGVEIWLETHGDFCCAADVQPVLAACPEIALVWDPVSAFVEAGEKPKQNGLPLHSAIRHVHIKDVRNVNSRWIPVLTGAGEFPLNDLGRVLSEIGYCGWLSFEWEKKWHPLIEEPEIAIPHFAQWLRSNWQTHSLNQARTPGVGA